jgi:hypothetical protein
LPPPSLLTAALLHGHTELPLENAAQVIFGIIAAPVGDLPDRKIGLIHQPLDAPHQAFRVKGNDHVTEYNEVHDVTHEVGDVGA